MDGVTLIRYRKPLVAADLWDHDITAHAPQSFIWALSNTGLSNQFRFQCALPRRPFTLKFRHIRFVPVPSHRVGGRLCQGGKERQLNR
jgi:hypothetical protein